MAIEDIYGPMIQPRGRAYRADQIARRLSYYDDPIDMSPGRLAGNSHVWGDATAEVQSRAIDALIAASEQAGLTSRQTAHVLAIARLESGFNPDAAAGTTSAYGLGQFVKDTAAAYGINDANRGSIDKQAEALVAHYQDNAALAKARGQGEEYIYKYHHDGPKRDYGGLGLSQKEVMPYLERYEGFVASHKQQRDYGLLRDIKALGDGLQNGSFTYGAAVVDGLPDYLRAHHARPHNAAVDGVLEPGEGGPAIRKLQEDLNRLGMTDGHGRKLDADGIYGRGTREAVENFQLWNGLPTTGITDLRTMAAIRNLLPTTTYALPGEAADINIRNDEASARLLHADPDVQPIRPTPAATVEAPHSPALHPSQQEAQPRQRLGNMDTELLDAIHRQLPAGTSLDQAANVTARARENGIREVHQLDKVAVVDGNAWVVGRTPGFWAKVDLSAPVPTLQESLRTIDAVTHQETQQVAQRQQAEQIRPMHRMGPLGSG